jgi:hypothetical protein
MKITIELPRKGARLLRAMSKITGASPAAILKASLPDLLEADYFDMRSESLGRICELCAALNLPINEAINRACESFFAENGQLRGCFFNLDDPELLAFAGWVSCHSFQSAEYACGLGDALVHALARNNKASTFSGIVAARPDGLFGVRISGGKE